MKTSFIIFSCILFFAVSGVAQHCPFDGASMVVIKLKDKKGTIVTTLKDSIFLVEVNNPLADSCSYEPGLLKLPFGSVTENLINKYDGEWKKRSATYVKECSFIKPGHYVVVLSMAGSSCMLHNGSDYKYLERKFEIRVKKGNTIKTLLPVPSTSIYKLCTGAGSWMRIKAIELTL